MKKILLVLISLLIVSALMFSLRSGVAWAACVGPDPGDTIEILQQKTIDCNRDLGVITNSLKPHEQKMVELQKDIDAIESNIAQLNKQIELKKAEIAKDEGKLAERQRVLDSRVRDFYKKDWQSGLEYMLVTMFSSDNVGEALSQMAYRQNLIDREKKNITSLVLEISDLAEAKRKLEETQVWLAKEKADLEIILAPIKKLVNEAKAYQKQLSTTVGSLSSRQQELIAARIGSLGISRSAASLGRCDSDLTNGRNASFGGTKFGAFTYGVPNRVGMNQWGAKGRAEAGQEPKTILAAYYNADYTEGNNQSTNIHVTGTNEYGQSFDDNWNIEEYLKHLYEIPTDWDMKALKAQAIAARSYALAYTDNGSGSICPSQQCQVVKRELNNDRWQQAVRETAGVVLKNGGQPIKAWFSSTHGGYVFSSGDIGWNQTSWTKRVVDSSGSVGSFSDLKNNAYDKDSPWFYCDWGWRTGDYNNTAWLRPEELADIVNVVLLAQKDSSTRKHLYQVDKPNPEGVDTWDAARVRSELGGGAFNSISDVTVSPDYGSGVITTVSVSGDAGSRQFSGNDFKNYFDLRAPANIAIVGPLYNIERK